ncbi:MAG: hypothetical protein LBU87_06825, partial [Lactobacillales bacterium]|nr:hypothetical protein [Lactobacillales bacterium]
EEFLKENLAILEKLNPKPGEEEELAEKRQMMMNMEKISAALQTARHVLENDETGVEGALSQAVRGIEKANELAQDKFAGILSAVMAAQENIADALGNLSQEMDGLEDVSSLSEIDDRLFALKDMARRHHVTVAELIPLKETLREKLDLLNTGTHRLAEAEKKEQQARLAYIEQAMALSKERHRAGERLDALVAQELPDLKLGQAVFKTQISSKTEEEFTADGIDEAVFLVSTNKGVPPAPIHKVASGGELARFMLALKLNLRGEGEMMTLIFDEVDSGVGGMTADAVGNRLKRLSKECQVLVVTHSPQVAAYGKHHYQVSKETAGDKTKTTVALLSTKARREEIARMLSGARVTESSLNAAAELLEHACKSPSLN